MDFLSNRRFRQSLLYRADGPADEGLSLERFAGCAFGTDLAAPQELEPGSDTPGSSSDASAVTPVTRAGQRTAQPQRGLMTTNRGRQSIDALRLRFPFIGLMLLLATSCEQAHTVPTADASPGHGAGGARAPDSTAVVARSGGLGDGSDTKSAMDGSRPEKPPVRIGPLMGLPSEEGPHLTDIRAMKGNSWLDLGSPLPDPAWGIGIGRAWSSKMVYASDFRGAFINGEGVHGATSQRNGKRHYNDDLFLYDINQHRWVCVYPGFELGTYQGKINQDGFEINGQGHPQPIAYMVHAYGGVTYDADTKSYLHMFNPSGGGYWMSSMPERVEFIKNNSHRLNALGGRQSDGTLNSQINQASPWIYDTLSGHWRRFKTAQTTPQTGHGMHLVYLPPLKKTLLLSGGGAHLYDRATNAWTKLDPGGLPPPQSIDAASCYDSKRNRVYIAMGSYGSVEARQSTELPNQVWAYDVETNTYLDLQATGTLPPRPVPVGGTNVSQMTYDSQNDVVLYFAFGRDLNGSLENRGIYAYDADKNEWTVATRSYPASWGKNWRSTGHMFYDAHLNAHFLYNAQDSGEGVMFVYRYKN